MCGPRAAVAPRPATAATAAAAGAPRRRLVSYPLEEIYPVTLVPGQPVRIARGCSLSPGKYELTVVVRERERQDARGRRRAAAVLRQTLDVPDFSTNELTTSTVMLADALTVLPGSAGASTSSASAPTSSATGRSSRRPTPGSGRLKS